ncbi:MAG: excinuclease ABC subunit A, partial [Bacteroidales bacterium]|nr:excinuclease ABC subunit A [Bacteroidales bacterium]
DDIRKLFSDQPYAKMNGYTNSFFSFNIDGGRCPVCLGEGYITVPMQFMADVKMVCEECHGHRFKQDILEVRYHGKNIDQVLDMSVDSAVDFFSAQKETAAKRVVEGLNVLQRVGLGYVKLGQSCSTLSGGESQRVMLAQFLSRDIQGKSQGKSQGKLFIFDEPTTGLHFHDVKKLLDAFNALVDAGNTIIVVEHNTDVIKAADWIIDLGPDSGDKGGEVDFTGTPDLLSQDPRWLLYL